MTADEIQKLSDEEIVGLAGHLMIDAMEASEPLPPVEIDYRMSWHLIELIQMAYRNNNLEGTGRGEAARAIVDKVAAGVARDPILQEFVQRGWRKR